MKVLRNLAYAPRYGAFGCGDWYLPPLTAGDPVLLIHGGGWNALDKKAMCGIAEFLAEELHLPVFNVNYRLAGPDAPWPAGLEDCLAAARYLLTAGECKKLWIIGASAGGHLALMTALTLPRFQVAGVVSLAGVADPRPDLAEHPERYLPLFGHAPSAAEVTDFSPLEKLTGEAPPILLTHAENDTAVPLASSGNFARKAQELRVPLSFYRYRKEEPTVPGLSHRIWLPGSSPHRLYPELEKVIADFIRNDPGYAADGISPAADRKTF